MKITGSALALVSIFAIGFVLAPCAESKMSESSTQTYDPNGLIGTPVENPLGEVVGTIKDVVTDSNGDVEFVIVSHDFYWEYVPRLSQTVVVCFSDMTVDPDKKVSVLKFSSWMLDFAPLFNKKR